MSVPLPQLGTVQLGYLLVFTLAAFACFVSIGRAQYITDRDTRVGLIGLLATSGAWALSHVGFLSAPMPRLQYGFYVTGLVIGLATVGPWLYFCSAYSGRSHHRNQTLQRVAVSVFLVIVTIKITNPIHGLYFSVEPATTPFAHLLVHHEPLHWIVMALAYALAFVGFFMLFELLTDVDFDTNALFVIVALAGAPVVLDLIGAATPYLLDITYSALGVPLFTIGVIYVYFDQFEAIRLAGEVDDPIVVLDSEDHLRDVNQSATDLFGDLRATVGEPFATVLPEIADVLDGSERIVSYEVDGRERYFQVGENPFAAGGERLGRSIVLTDVTESERYRRELERQNARLERFASVVSHDLRNPLNVAQGRTDLALEADGGNEHLLATKRALDRMAVLIEDVLRLARLGQSIDETEPVSVPRCAEESWKMVDTGEATLIVADGFDLEVEADADRFRQLLENLFRNAVEHGGPDVTVTVDALEGEPGFFVADDGPGIPEDTRDEVFGFGFTTSKTGTGFGLSIVKEIVDAHGWSIRVVDAEAGGARFEIGLSR